MDGERRIKSQDSEKVDIQDRGNFLRIAKELGIQTAGKTESEIREEISSHAAMKNCISAVL